MWKLVQSFVIALLIWESFVAVSLGGVMLLSHRTSLGVEVKSWEIWVFFVGLLITLISWPVCRAVGRAKGALIGSGIGLAIPILAGWLWGQLMEPWVFSWKSPFIGIDAWITGLDIAIPSAIAGGIMGYFQARSAIPHPRQPTGTPAIR